MDFLSKYHLRPFQELCNQPDNLHLTNKMHNPYTAILFNNK